MATYIAGLTKVAMHDTKKDSVPEVATLHPNPVEY